MILTQPSFAELLKIVLTDKIDESLSQLSFRSKAHPPHHSVPHEPTLEMDPPEADLIVITIDQNATFGVDHRIGHGRVGN